jgi:hypothetical protein
MVIANTLDVAVRATAGSVLGHVVTLCIVMN